MASTSPIKFIETALLATGPFSLSYTDPDQKWLIRDHLISLLQDFPKFELSTDTFTHNDGTTVNLLCLQGSLHLPNQTLKLPSVPLTIWVHENYPFMPPLVFAKPNDATIHINHPFVDPSGFASPPYIKTWEHPRCNLLELTRKLVKIFSHHHPLAHKNSISSHSSLMSKMEALDRLAAMIHYDVESLQVNAEKEIGELSKLQAEMVKRAESIKAMTRELETERKKLRERVQKIEDEADVLVNWLKVNNPTSIEAVRGNLGVDEMFEGDDEESRVILESLASDRAIEDLLCELDEVVEGGFLSSSSYVKHVRALSREQYFHRARHVRFYGGT